MHRRVTFLPAAMLAMFNSYARQPPQSRYIFKTLRSLTLTIRTQPFWVPPYPTMARPLPSSSDGLRLASNTPGSSRRPS